MRRWVKSHPGQPTALVHEVWLRLGGPEGQVWRDRSYFFAAAAVAMRRILVDHARRKSRLKHGGGQVRLELDGLDLAEPLPDDKVLMIDDALSKLEQAHPERAKVVELRFFAGMTNKEIAEAMGIGERTVNRHWLCAKQWLFQKIRAPR